MDHLSSGNSSQFEGGENMSFSSSGNNSRQNIRQLLTKLPPHYPISGFLGDGHFQNATTFVAFDQDTNLAYFSQVGGSLVVVDSSRITLIEFPAV